MEKKEKKSEMRCIPHHKPFSFFCFDEKEFVCNECYKKHRGHKLEIRGDIEDKAKSLESLKKNDSTKILDVYASYRDNLEEISTQIEKEIATTNSEIAKLKKNTILSFPKTSLFDLSFEEYEAIENLSEKYRNIQTFSKKLEQVLVTMSLAFTDNCFKPIYTEYKWIQQEISVVDNSEYHVGFPPQIMLEPQKGDYYLSEGNRNHFITFDFKEEHYIKGFKIKLSNFDCTLKNFKVSVLKEGLAVIVKSFVCPKYDDRVDWNHFDLNEAGKEIRFDLIDNWGESGGNYILIKEIQFNVGISSFNFNI